MKFTHNVLRSSVYSLLNNTFEINVQKILRSSEHSVSNKNLKFTHANTHNVLCTSKQLVFTNWFGKHKTSINLWYDIITYFYKRFLVLGELEFSPFRHLIFDILSKKCDRIICINCWFSDYHSQKSN